MRSDHQCAGLGFCGSAEPYPLPLGAVGSLRWRSRSVTQSLVFLRLGFLREQWLAFGDRVGPQAQVAAIK